jgi:hypothetical protein
LTDITKPEILGVRPGELSFPLFRMTTMEHARRRVHVVREGEYYPQRMSGDGILIEVSAQWAHGVVSLVQASREFRYAGLIVTNVGPAGEGRRAGMVRGDVLLRYGEQELDSVATLRRLSVTQARYTATGKTVRIDAGRGKEDIEFDVHAGPLGITVSPLLHRLNHASPRPKSPRRSYSSRDATAMPAIPRVVHTLEPARMQAESGPAFVIVPNDMALPLLAVLRALESSGSRARAKRAKSLLTAARHLAR